MDAQRGRNTSTYTSGLTLVSCGRTVGQWRLEVGFCTSQPLVQRIPHSRNWAILCAFADNGHVPMFYSAPFRSIMHCEEESWRERERGRGVRARTSLHTNSQTERIKTKIFFLHHQLHLASVVSPSSGHNESNSNLQPSVCSLHETQFQSNFFFTRKYKNKIKNSKY